MTYNVSSGTLSLYTTTDSVNERTQEINKITYSRCVAK